MDRVISILLTTSKSTKRRDIRKLLRHDTTNEKRQEPIFFFDFGVSLIMNRVISVPLSTSERKPH